MKVAALSASLLATALAVSATALPEQSKHSDGLYKSYINEGGEEVIDFVPWNELGNTTFVPITSVVPAAKIKQRSALMKRREGCHPTASVPSSETDAANKCLIDSFKDDPVVTTSNGYVKYWVCLRLPQLLGSCSDCENLISVLLLKCRFIYLLV